MVGGISLIWAIPIICHQGLGTLSVWSQPMAPVSMILNQSQGGKCICRVLGIGAGVSRECFGP